MPTISVRISEDDRKRYERYGTLSDTVRKALELYDRDRKRREWMERLDRIQKENPVRIDPDEIVKVIRQDRSSH